MQPVSAQPNFHTYQVLVPDCCNIGVVFRTLVTVNLLTLLGIAARGGSWSTTIEEFIETSMLVEMIALFSLMALCGLRQLSLQRWLSDWGQRFLCGAVPALIAFALLHFFVMLEWFVLSFPHLNTAYVLLICFTIGIGFQHYFELRAKAFSPALGEARLQALQARIRPHFLFNSLNAVLSLVRTEPQRAETALEDLADLFRALMHDTRNMSTLQEELTFCEQYLSIERIRLGERLQVVWRIDKLSTADLQAIQMASLLLQPLLENAVHYGVEPALSPSLITVEIQRSLDKIDIRITNPYFPNHHAHGGNHMALDNIRQRLSLLYDIEAQLIAGVVGAVFEVKLRFPLQKL